MQPPLSRTVVFFKAGSFLSSLNSPDDYEARADFERILGDIDIRLGN